MNDNVVSDKSETFGKFLRTLKEALSGSERIYTEGPIGETILVLAIPMVLEMVMEGVFAVVDVFFVGKLGAQAVATVGLTESILTLIYTLAMGLSIGATSVVARRVGEKDIRSAREAAGQSILLGILISAVLGLLGFFFSDGLLSVMGASPEVLKEGASYAKIMLAGNGVILLLFLGNATVRGAGDGYLAMRSLWLANFINIALGPCLIFGLGPFPKLGLTGAALATTIGRGTGTLYVLSRLFGVSSRIRLKWADLKPKIEVMNILIKLSGSGVFQNFVGMASWIVLMKIVSGFGSAAVAGYTIGIRIILFLLMPAMGLGNAAATLVGQSLGAGKPERAQEVVKRAGFYNLCFLGSLGLIFYILATPMIGFYSVDSETAEIAVRCLRTVLLGFPFYAFGMVYTQSFNGAGDTKTPTRINAFVFWVFEIPFAYGVTQFLGFGPQGVFTAITLAFSILAVISAVIFKKGKWKEQVV